MKVSNTPDQHRTYELDMVAEVERGLPWNTFNLATATTTSTMNGGITSTYDQVAIKWLSKVIDAAKKNFYYEQLCMQEVIPEGGDKIAIPKMPVYDSQIWGATGEEIAAGSEINWTSIDPTNTVTVTTVERPYGATISNKLLRVSNVPYIQHVKDKLIYQQLDKIDSTTKYALVGEPKATCVAGATPMTSSTIGMQTLVGSLQSNASNALVAGDIITPDLIKQAVSMLEADYGWYYTTSNALTKNTTNKKNPWKNENDFVLVISPEQKAQLLQDTQFTNAAEFGSDDVVLNGQIAKYLGVKILCTPAVPSFASGDQLPIQGATPTAATAGHVATLLKAGKAGVIGWSQKPKFHVFPFPSALQTRMVLEMSFGVSELYSDAMVNIYTADK